LLESSCNAQAPILRCKDGTIEVKESQLATRSAAAPAATCAVLTLEVSKPASILT